MLDQPRSDIVLRAHTGTGKSFGALLALLSTPRLKIRIPTKSDVESEEPTFDERSVTSAIIIVPSNELALQYANWARKILPPSDVPSLDPILQVLVRGEPRGEVDPQVERLIATPPHIIVATHTRFAELLDDQDIRKQYPRISSYLGIKTARTLLMDEADAILDLPGRFASAARQWKAIRHTRPGIRLLNRIMRHRPTCSSGEPSASAGLEFMLPSEESMPKRQRGGPGPDFLPAEGVRRELHKNNEEILKGGRNRIVPAAPRMDAQMRRELPPEKLADPARQPLQFVCLSATANSVLRHFLGAKTGWLRIGMKEKNSRGRWIDLTGLSGSFSRAQKDGDETGWLQLQEQDENAEELSPMPKEIQHHCIVVDGLPDGAEGDMRPMRNLTWSRPPPPDVLEEQKSWRPDSVPGMPEKNTSEDIMRACAFQFAVDAVQKGLAVIPATWSIRQTESTFESLGVPVKIVGSPDAIENNQENSPVLYVLQTTSLRGIDIPGISHVFILGVSAAKDAVHYTHIAGRVSRMQPFSPNAAESKALLSEAGVQQDEQATLPSFVRPPGKVITFVNGLTAEQLARAVTPVEEVPSLVSSNELKMKTMYKRIGIRPKELVWDSALFGQSGGSSVKEGEEEEARWADETASAATATA